MNTQEGSGKKAMHPWTPDRIRRLRKRYGDSQAQFAKRFLLRVSAIENWEQGRQVPSGPAQIILEQLEDKAPREREPAA